jgi:uncharacterized protein (DUF2147 family)
MFCRFRGITLGKSNGHMRFFVMQNASSARIIRRIGLGSGMIAAILAASAMPAFAGAASASAAEIGLWYDDTGEGAVKIEPCGNSLCGRIVWLKEPLHDDGTPLIDRHNPEASKQSRTICGLQILGELKPSSDGGYDNGWVYDPKEGKSYSLAIRLNGRDELSITGYLGVKLLGKTFTWTRAKTELPSCAATPAALPIEAKPAVKSKPDIAVGTAAANPAPAADAAPSTGVVPAAAAAKAVSAAKAAPATASAPAAKPATDKAAAKAKATGSAEVLPWSTSAKPAAGASQLGASGAKPAAKKTKPPEQVIQQRPETASQ